jgi:hypothetical protein
MIFQHLVHELLGLIQVARAGRLIHLVDRGIGGQHGAGARQSHNQGQRSCNPLEHYHVCPPQSEAKDPHQ